MPSISSLRLCTASREPESSAWTAPAALRRPTRPDCRSEEMADDSSMETMRAPILRFESSSEADCSSVSRVSSGRSPMTSSRRLVERASS